MATTIALRSAEGMSGCHQLRQPSATQSLNIQEFSFASQSCFNAGQDLVLTRSDSFIVRKPPKTYDIWKRPAPDFRPQQYLPKPPKRNSRESMQPWKYGTFSGQRKSSGKTEEKTTDALPKILRPDRPCSSKMTTRFKIDNPQEARVKFVKEGTYPKDKYQMPKKHDFRGYLPLGPLGLPEFVTAPEHDPYNIKFKNKNRDIIVGLPQPRSERSQGRQMGQHMSLQPRYQPELIMPPLKWPTTSGEFTRFRRRNRSPHTVLLDQIESTLEDRWAHERQERNHIQEEMERDRRQRQFQESVARQLADRMQMMSASTMHSPSEGGSASRQVSGQANSQSTVNHQKMSCHGDRSLITKDQDDGVHEMSLPTSTDENYSLDAS